MPARHPQRDDPRHPHDKALWRRLAARYEWLVERIVPDASAFFEACLSFVPEGPISVLELGGGTGYATERLLRRNPEARITCLDLSPDMLAAARAKPALQAVQFLQGDIRGGWPGGRFDVIFTTLCLHHLAPAERRVTLERARLGLRRNGRFINGDIFKPATRWEETLLRRRWLTRLRASGLAPQEAQEMLAKRRRNMRCFDTLAGYRAALDAAGFRRVVCPWTCELAGVFVGFAGGLPRPRPARRLRNAPGSAV
jgi:tRNA (cmo5U34)-methyltransferase